MMTLSSTNKPSEQNLRLRVFAGPNGSGKSTVIKSVKHYKVNGKSIDFGIYINADDIAARLREGTFSFDEYEIATNHEEFTQIASNSGLIGAEFDFNSFVSSFRLSDNAIKLKTKSKDEILAQIIAVFLRKKLLLEHKKFSFETVF